MSGGYFDYVQYRLNGLIDELELVIEDSTEYTPETIQEFKNGVYALKRAYVFTNRIDYLLSGDDGEESFHSRLKKELEGIKE